MDAIDTAPHGGQNVAPMLRPATTADVRDLVRIENGSFETDRFTARAFRYLLSRANAATVVDEGPDGAIRGYAMVLFNRGTSLARLYSIAVDASFRRCGVGGGLLAAIEDVARERDAATMRLEVRADDPETQAWYASQGYRRFGVYGHYYDDQADAVRMEKSLAPPLDPSLARVPFYAQSLDFTCGPAALLMAMHALDASIPLNQHTELGLWRESTTVFMTRGHGGCSPEGLALAAANRGFQVELFLSQPGVLFIDSVRSEKKKQIIRMVQEGFRKDLKKTGVPMHFRPLGAETMRRRFEAGGIPVVLISSYRLDLEKQPHWVVVTGFDGKYIYLHDPSVDADEGKTITDCMQIPIQQRDFAKMARYGRSQLKAALIVAKGPGSCRST